MRLTPACSLQPPGRLKCLDGSFRPLGGCASSSSIAYRIQEARLHKIAASNPMGVCPTPELSLHRPINRMAKAEAKQQQRPQAQQPLPASVVCGCASSHRHQRKPASLCVVLIGQGRRV